ncbi:MAG: ATP synthase F1 subunit epsilon [Archangium sp.]|nr:ATP synthase F1 subunit epsilon [Archangium sp.]
MAKLNVEIVTPERRLAQSSADEVIAPGADGLFGVRPGHTPYLAALQPGPLTLRDGAATTIYFVAGGFVEAGPQLVRVLADSAELQKDIDVEAAKKRLAEAEAAVKSLPLNDPKLVEQNSRIAIEKKRLELAKS